MKKLTAILLSLCMAFSITACGGKTAEAPAATTAAPAATTAAAAAAETATEAAAAETAAPDQQLVMALSVDDMTNEAFILMYQAMQKYADENNIKLLMSDCKQNVGMQIDAIENFINTGVNALIVDAFDPEAIKGAVKEAADAGMLVYTWNGIIDEATMCVLLREYDLGVAMGTQAGNWINANWPDDEEVMIGFTGSSTSPVALERMRGMEESIKATCPRVVSLGFQDGWTPSVGYEVCENFLQMDPEMKGMLCINDSAALGAAEAAAAAGRTPEDFAVFGADGNQAAYDALQDPNPHMFHGTVDIGMAELGVNFMKAAQKKLTTGEDSEQLAFLLQPVNEENVEEYLANR